MGVGPAAGVEWEEHRDEERCGFTFCVRAAEQVKELGYAHNLRVLLRKWPKIWSCDGGFAQLFRPERRQKILTEFWVKPVEVLRAFLLRRPAKGSSSTVRHDRQKEKSTDDIIVLFKG